MTTDQVNVHVTENHIYAHTKFPKTPNTYNRSIQQDYAST